MRGRMRVWYHWRDGAWECTIALPTRRASGRGRSKKEAYGAAYTALYGPAGARPAWCSGGRGIKLVG